MTIKALRTVLRCLYSEGTSNVLTVININSRVIHQDKQLHVHLLINIVKEHEKDY